jgi:hypothetical protein
MTANGKRRRASSGGLDDIEPGSRLFLDGQEARVRMVTATSALVHLEEAGIDEWVLRTSGRLQPLDEEPAGVGKKLDSRSTGRDAAVTADGKDEEDDECCVCGQGGKLTCCDICPRVYHSRCLSAAEAERLRLLTDSDDDWWCPHCIRTVRLTFCMQRILSSGLPATAIAEQLYEYISEPQHETEAGWDVIKEVAGALEAGMCAARTGAAQPLPTTDTDVAELVAMQLRRPVRSEWWRGCYDHVAEPRAPRQPANAAAAGPIPAHAEETGLDEDEEDMGGLSGGSQRATEQTSAGAVRTSAYRGVSKRYGRWKARIKLNGSDLALGDFDDEKTAARAYDEKAREIHGAAAILNFPLRDD